MYTPEQIALANTFLCFLNIFCFLSATLFDACVANFILCKSLLYDRASCSCKRTLKTILLKTTALVIFLLTFFDKKVTKYI